VTRTPFLHLSSVAAHATPMQLGLAEQVRRQRERTAPPPPPEGRQRLLDFVRGGWHVLEPGNPFVSGWHLDVICHHLEAVTDRQIRNLVINIPPRHMKSLAVAVFWPAWSWTFQPESRWIFASYGKSLASRDSRKTRRVIKSAWYQSQWGELVRLVPDQDQVTRFENERQGYRIATSVNGEATGEGGDFLVADDPHKVGEGESEAKRTRVLSWWDETMSTRHNNPKTGCKVIVMQRVHDQDLAGHVLEQGGYHHLCLPARYERPAVMVSGGIPQSPAEPVSVLRESHGSEEARPTGALLGALTPLPPSPSVAGTELTLQHTMGSQTSHEFAANRELAVEEDVASTAPPPHLGCSWGSDPRVAQGELLWPSRVPEVELTALETAMGPIAAAGQLQQNPVPRAGAVFRAPNFRPLPKGFDEADAFGKSQRARLQLVQFWDTAWSEKTSADYTAGVTVGVDRGRNLYILHAWRARIAEESLPVAMGRVIGLIKPHYVAIEEPAFKQAQARNLKALLSSRIGGHVATYDTVPVDRDKVARASVAATRSEVGQVFADRAAAWWPAFLQELLRFPKGAHDDQVDAFAGAVLYALEKVRFAESSEDYKLDGRADTSGAFDPFAGHQPEILQRQIVKYPPVAPRARLAQNGGPRA
jgi:predicted phage terminase large subunit-like protein